MTVGEFESRESDLLRLADVTGVLTEEYITPGDEVGVGFLLALMLYCLGVYAGMELLP
ncbi:hypothetical protein H7347_07365 [Corynebacterium sp. zg-331]|uniref:hypothetical protein n=1 Tax=unclassified Corynebacterium TaxID=2624378 RepID=UPI001642F479|nr:MULTISPECIES: hypothetical protein [unclassified Corynebacterium]MBC3186392.1 hypothetical protein [Corynebacterium sp. zg-331]